MKSIKRRSLTGLISLMVFLLILMPNVFATLNQPLDYNLISSGNNQDYSVFFDGEGEATITAKIQIYNKNSLPFNKIKLELPEISYLQDVYQQTKSGINKVKYLREPFYNNKILTFDLKEPVDKNEILILVLNYKSNQYVKKNLGEFKFNFETIKIPYDTDNIRIAINIPQDMHLKGTTNTVNYIDNVYFKNSFLAAPESLDGINYAKGYIQTAKFLDPFESFTVSGNYAKSLAWLQRWKIIGVTVLFCSLMFLSLIIIKKFKKIKTKKKKLYYWY